MRLAPYFRRAAEKFPHIDPQATCCAQFDLAQSLPHREARRTQSGSINSHAKAI
jgi:hypothetical protein